MSEAASGGKLSTAIIKARKDAKKKEKDIFLGKTDYNEDEDEFDENHKATHTGGLDHSMGLPQAKKNYHHHHGGSDPQRAEKHSGKLHATFEHPLHASRKSASPSLPPITPSSLSLSFTS
jgi:hypothetical protein